jgi:uncharacterized protein
MGDERFDWDEANANHIWDEHRVSVHEVEEVFDDPRFLVDSRTRAEGENRLRALGKAWTGRILFVVFTKRAARIRVVTARDAGEDEKKRYRRGRK